jgi:rhodanese-related sulfurtransferase
MTQDIIPVEKLQEMLDAKQPVTMLDVRPRGERAEWWIPGSLHLDAYDALRAGDSHALDAVDLRPDVPVVTICGEGKTSLIAAEQLRQHGVQAVSLAGGMYEPLPARRSVKLPTPFSGAS